MKLNSSHTDLKFGKVKKEDFKNFEQEYGDEVAREMQRFMHSELTEIASRTKTVEGLIVKLEPEMSTLLSLAREHLRENAVSYDIRQKSIFDLKKEILAKGVSIMVSFSEHKSSTFFTQIISSCVVKYTKNREFVLGVAFLHLCLIFLRPH